MTEFETNQSENLNEGVQEDEGIQDVSVERTQPSSEELSWKPKGQDDGLQHDGEEERQQGDDDGKENDEVQQKDDVEKNHFVALKQERQKRQQIEREMRENAAKMQRMEELFSKFQEKQTKPPEEEIPSYDEDPLGHLTAKQKKLEQYIQKQNQTEQQYNQQMQYQQKLQNVVKYYETQAQEYSKENPDFGNAYKFLIENRTKQYKAAGYQPQQISELIKEDELSVVSNAYQNGQNPAELVFEVAKAAGYTPNSGKKNTVNDSLSQVRDGMKSNKSLANKGSSTNSTPMGLEQLANMDPNDPKFDYYWQKLTGSKA